MLDRLDISALWDAFTPEEQRLIGLSALTGAVAHEGQAAGLKPTQAYAAAAHAAQHAFEAVLNAAGILEPANIKPPNLAPLGVRSRDMDSGEATMVAAYEGEVVGRARK